MLPQFFHSPLRLIVATGTDEAHQSSVIGSSALLGIQMSVIHTIVNHVKKFSECVIVSIGCFDGH